MQLSTLVSPSAATPMGTGRARDFQHVSLLAQAGGTDLSEAVAPFAGLALADLDFTAEARPIAFREDASWYSTNQALAIVRPATDNAPPQFYGAVGRTYSILQHKAMATVLEMLGIDITQAMSFDAGRSGLLVARLGQEDIGGDTVRMSLYLQNSHGGKGSFRAGFGVERLQCKNQFAGIFRNGLSHPHTSGIVRFAEGLAQRIDLRKREFLTDAETFRRMRECPLGKEASRWILEQTFHAQLAAPIRDKDSGEMRPRTLADLPMVANVRQAFADGRAIESEDRNNTVWRMYNAITEAITHTDAKEARDPVAAARRRLEGILQGTRGDQLTAARTACEAVLAC
jgi:hypothetical protein